MPAADLADPAPEDRVMDALMAVSSAQAEIGRLFQRTHGLRTSDAAAIVQIIEAERRGSLLTPAVLAERVALTSGAVSILLARLEKAGHVKRSHESIDRRVVTLRSTSTIHDAFDAFYEPIGQRVREALRSLSLEDLRSAEAAAQLTAAAMTVDSHRE